MKRLQSGYEGWMNLPQPKKVKILRVISIVSFFFFSLFLVICLFSATRQMSVGISKTVIFMEAMPSNLEVIRYYAQRRDVEVSMIVLALNGWVENLTAAYGSTVAFLKVLYNEGYSKRIPVFYGNSLAEGNLNSSEYCNTSSALTSNTAACSSRWPLPESLALNAEQMFGGAFYLRQVDVGDMAMQPSFFAQPLSTFLSKNDADFLVLGPCTDAAWFLQNYDKLRGKVSSIVVAGGAFLSGGNVAPVIGRDENVELSFFFDPAAADYLLRGSHGRPVTLIPLDATIPWRPSAYDAIIGDEVGDTSVSSAGIVAKALYGFYSFLESYASRVPLSIIAATYKSDVYLQDGVRGLFVPVHVLQGNSTSIGGLSFRPESGNFSVKVVLELEAEKFFDHLINVNSLSLA